VTIRSAFDRRVASDAVLSLIRRFQAEAPCHLGGGTALSGAYLGHRLSRDIDLFCHAIEDVRHLVSALPAIAEDLNQTIEIRRDQRSHVRCVLPGLDMDLDLVHEALADLEAGPLLEGIVTESLLDLRASKLTCLLSRSEPRDLVDVMMLDRAGFRPEVDLVHALRKDAGIDPGTLAWLLRSFPVEPLPMMLVPLSVDDLRTYRDDLSERLRRLAVPQAPA